MIGLTRTGGEHCLLDPAAIQRIESSPTTVVHLVDGGRYGVEETIDEIVGRVRAARAEAATTAWRLPHGPVPGRGSAAGSR